MNVVVIAPHNDDEILGVGGTMAYLAKKGHSVTVCEVTVSGTSLEKTKLQKNEAIASHKMLNVQTFFMDLPAVGLKEMKTRDINSAFSIAMSKLNPDIVFIPHKGDMHIDHRMTVESAMVALRPVSFPNLKGIYAYETLSETDWNVPSVENAFIPNAFVDISNELETKLEAMKCHASQLREYPHPRSLEAIKALAMHRGTTICRPYAEAFMVIREEIGWQ